MGSSGPPIPSGRSSAVYSSRTGSPERVRKAGSVASSGGFGLTAMCDSILVGPRTAPSARSSLSSAMGGELTRELERLLGAEHVLQAPAGSPYNHDAARRRGVDGHADAVVLPGSAEEVARVVG